MKIVVDGESYEFDPDRMLNIELMAIERVTGFTSMDFMEKVERGSMIAITALVWVLRKRTGRSEPFEGIEFSVSSIDLVEDEPVKEPEVVKPVSSPTLSMPTSSASLNSSAYDPGRPVALNEVTT